MFFKNRFYGSSQLYCWSQTTTAIRNTFCHPCHSFFFAIVKILSWRTKSLLLISKCTWCFQARRDWTNSVFQIYHTTMLDKKKKIYIHNVFGIFVSLVFQICVEFLPLYICYHKIAIMSWSSTTEMCVQIHYFCIDVFEKLYY